MTVSITTKTSGCSGLTLSCDVDTDRLRVSESILPARCVGQSNTPKSHPPPPSHYDTQDGPQQTAAAEMEATG